MNRDERAVATITLWIVSISALWLFLTEFEFPSDNKETSRTGIVNKCAFEQIAQTNQGRYLFHFELMEYENFEFSLQIDVSQIQELRKICRKRTKLKVNFRVVRTALDWSDSYVVESVGVIQ